MNKKVKRTSMERNQCSEYISLIMHFTPEDGGSTTSETLVSNYQTTRRNKSDNTDFYNFHINSRQTRYVKEMHLFIIL